MDEVQLAVAGEARPGEVAGADDGGERAHAVGPVVRPDVVLVEEVRLGVQEPLVVEADLHLVGAEERDQVLDQFQRGLVERLGLQVALEPLLQRLGVGFEADVGAGVRLGAQDEAKGTDLVQPVLHQSVAGDGEVGRGDVERLAGALGQQLIQRVRHAVPLVVDDKRDRHDCLDLPLRGTCFLCGGSEQVAVAWHHSAAMPTLFSSTLPRIFPSSTSSGSRTGRVERSNSRSSDVRP